MQSMKNIFVFGCFRSGTTLLSKVLSAHEKIYVASDPYFQFFKAYRDEIGLRYGLKNIEKQPIDTYSDKSQILILKKIRKDKFRLHIKKLNFKKILDRIKKFSFRDSPKLKSFLKFKKIKSYKKLLDKLLNIILLAYGNEKVKYIGFKVVFCEEFISPIRQSYKKGKIICIVRDPRAVYASNTGQKNPYPIKFVAEFWNKSVNFILNNLKYKNIILIKYENLINQPKKTIKNICKFLNVDFSEKMINENFFLDGFGRPWKANSSFSKSNKSFNSKNINRWKRILRKQDIKFIENFCNYQMRSIGYKKTYKYQKKLINQRPQWLKKKPPLWFRNKNLNEYIKRYT